MIKKIVIILIIAFKISDSYSQNLAIYESFELIKPSWLDPKYISMTDSLEKIFYLSIYGGTGFNLNNLSSDGIFPNRYFGNTFINASFYSRQLQFSIRNNLQVGEIHNISADIYHEFSIFNPKLQLSYYPFKSTDSYLGQQIRIQLSWLNNFNKTKQNAPAVYTTSASIDLGGYLTDYSAKSSFPKTALFVSYNKGINTNFSSTYGINAFTGVTLLNNKRIINTVYLQIIYNRQVLGKLDQLNNIRYSFINELIYNKRKNYAFYLYINYNTDYLVANANDQNVYSLKTITYGFSFYFSLFNKFYYKYH